MGRFIIAVIVVFTLFDSLLGALVFEVTGSADLGRAILYVKYALFAVCFIGFMSIWGFKVAIRPFELAGLVYVFVMSFMVLAAGALFPGHPLESRFQAYVFPVVIYFAGLYLGSVFEINLREALAVYIVPYLAAAIFVGFPIYFIGPEWFWGEVLDYAYFIVEIKSLDDVVMGMPGNFYLDPWGERIPRFVGTFGDPLAAGYSAMILAILSWFAYPRMRYPLLFVFLMIIYASATRAAGVGLIIAALVFIYARQYGFLAILGASIFGAFLILVAGQIVAEGLGDGSTEGHVLSIQQAIGFADVPTLLAGTFGSGTEVLFEPGFFNIIFTFGVVPLLLLLVFMGGIYRTHRFSDDSATQSIAAVFLAGTVTMAVFSPTFFGITAAWFAWFLAGLMSPSARRSMQAAPPALPTRPALTVRGA